MSALVLRPQPGTSPGLLADWATARGVRIRTADVEGDDLGAPDDGLAFAVVLGSTDSLCAGAPAAALLAWLRAADAAALPVLGIGYGAQAMCLALGGAVHRCGSPETGWVEVETNDADRVPAGPWPTAHTDAMTPPPLAYEVARSPACVQAFCLRRHLGVQFHPEAAPAGGRAAADALRLFDGFAARAGLGPLVH